MTNILVVDDDQRVLRSIQQILEDEEKYAVITAESGPEALQIVTDNRPDLIILDIIMPEMDGLEVCRRLRSDPFTAKIPIIFLTAKGRPHDVVDGLDSGADDYLIKPFEVIELPARVRAVLRRSAGGQLDPESDTLTIGDIKLSTAHMHVQVGARTVELTSIEHRLLHCLMTYSGRPVSVERLLEMVWEYPPGVGDPNLARVHIANLRNKIDDKENASYIRNVRGRGYMIAT